MAGALEHVLDREPQIGVPVVGLAEGAGGGAPASFVTAAEIAAQPRPIVRWSASANGRPVRNTAAIGSSSGLRARR